MNLCIIPARGGSKRIPRKNIKEFCGKPIIAYSIEAAIKSGCFDRIVVSTDDEEIAEVSIRYGAEVPFLRSEELADDHSVVTDVVVDSIIRIEKMDRITLRNVCLIYATAPMIRSVDIKSGLDRLLADEKDFAIGVTSYAFPIQRALRIIDGKISQYENSKNQRSQDLEECYHDAAQFCWGTKEAFVKKYDFFSHKAVPIVIPRKYVQDIDSLEDWEMAEALYSAFSV